MARRAIFILGLIVSLSTPALGQDEAILSKEDAAAVFSMNKQEWNGNVLASEAVGLTATIEGENGVLKMGIQYSEGVAMLVSPSYDYGDARPSFVQVVVVYPEPLASIFTEETARAVKEKAVAEMSPEYDVTALHEESEIGFMFHFFISER